jgi:hypothetical protein
MTEAWENGDVWAHETNHDVPDRRSAQEAPEPAKTWTSLFPAALILTLMAAGSIALGAMYLQRSGVTGAIGAVFFLSAGACLLFYRPSRSRPPGEDRQR